MQRDERTNGREIPMVDAICLVGTTFIVTEKILIFKNN